MRLPALLLAALAALPAAAEDRQRMALGKPQRYGTQYKKVDGTWQLWPVDPSVTDEERARWHCPPLASQQASVDKMNAGK